MDTNAYVVTDKVRIPLTFECAECGAFHRRGAECPEFHTGHCFPYHIFPTLPSDYDIRMAAIHHAKDRAGGMGALSVWTHSLLSGDSLGWARQTILNAVAEYYRSRNLNK